MQFCRINDNEFFRLRGIRFQKVNSTHAKRCDTGEIKLFYGEIPVDPEDETPVPPQEVAVKQ